MLFQSRRSATVRTLNFCETLFLRRENYMMVAHHFPMYAKKVRKTAIKVMWQNMLTSNTLKAALIRAAEARDRELSAAEETVSDLTDQMHTIMTTMTERLAAMESLAHEKREQREKSWHVQEDVATYKVEKLEKENRLLKRRLTVQLVPGSVEENGQIGEKQTLK